MILFGPNDRSEYKKYNVISSRIPTPILVFRWFDIAWQMRDGYLFRAYSHAIYLKRVGGYKSWGCSHILTPISL